MSFPYIWVSKLVFILVGLCWAGLVTAFILLKPGSHATEVKRNPRWKSGLLLQGLAVAAVWLVHRPLSRPAVRLGGSAELAVSALIGAVAIGSVWMMIAAKRALGKQWAYQARLVEGHRLVTSGPYRIVRHPVYTGFFGLMLATGLANSYWGLLPPAAVLFYAGTAIRIRGEEQLLREAFGPEFESYRRQVPRLLPGPR